MNEKLDKEIEDKKIELDRANKNLEKYQATVPIDKIPLNIEASLEHDFKEMKKDFESRDKIEHEYVLLLRKKRGEK